jgi:APA family basic amino acid/polyamine antiporter
VIISFAIAAVVSGLASLCYAEMASLVPTSGSAYTCKSILPIMFAKKVWSVLIDGVDAYATLGELVAWIIGWDLLLEYLVGAATVGVGWSGEC